MWLQRREAGGASRRWVREVSRAKSLQALQVLVRVGALLQMQRDSVEGLYARG